MHIHLTYQLARYNVLTIYYIFNEPGSSSFLSDISFGSTSCLYYFHKCVYELSQLMESIRMMHII